MSSPSPRGDPRLMRGEAFFDRSQRLGAIRDLGNHSSARAKKSFLLFHESIMMASLTRALGLASLPAAEYQHVAVL